MFYGWEDIKIESRKFMDSEANMLNNPDSMEDFSELKRKVEVMSLHARAKDANIAQLQQELETTTAALNLERAEHAKDVTRNKEVERMLEERMLRERDMEKQMNDRSDWYENEIQRLVSLLQLSEEAEERLAAQLGDFEVEGMEQVRYFNAEVAWLAHRLAQEEEKYSSAQSELERMRQRKLTLKEMETMDLEAQISKLKHECDTMREMTGLLQGELERTKVQVENLKRDLAMADVALPLQMKERPTLADKPRKSSQLCRSESLNPLIMRGKYGNAAIAV